jgi:hypothetical protein
MQSLCHAKVHSCVLLQVAPGHFNKVQPRISSTPHSRLSRHPFTALFTLLKLSLRFPRHHHVCSLCSYLAFLSPHHAPARDFPPAYFTQPFNSISTMIASLAECCNSLFLRLGPLPRCPTRNLRPGAKPCHTPLYPSALPLLPPDLEAATRKGTLRQATPPHAERNRPWHCRSMQR